jgi:diguanylate cyclase (GGDEF)-like protein
VSSDFRPPGAPSFAPAPRLITGDGRVVLLDAAGAIVRREPRLTADCEAIVDHVLAGVAAGASAERVRELVVEVFTLMDHAVTHDSMTKLSNRLGLARRFEAVTASGEGCSLLYVDLDDFKPVNDHHGHVFGDKVLGVVVERLRCSVECLDLVARIGGDEFAVLVPGRAGDPARLARIAERIIDAVSQPLRIDADTVSISASVGIASGDRQPGLERLLADADAAMYQAKRDGGSCYRVAPSTCTV